MTPAVDIQELAFGYERGRPVLDSVTFRVAAGERVGIAGPNGAGKTSLFLCLMGVLKPTGGRACVMGLDVRDASAKRELPRRAGIVFQDSDDQLFQSRVCDDVAFGPLNLGLDRDETLRRVAESLERVGMAGTEGRVPFHLSGGEKRRVALAGVLAMRPEVLLLDEPSVFLDPRGRRELVSLLRGLEGTMLIASHDLEFLLEVCPRVLVLDAGKVAADGGAREVLGDAALMEAHGLEVPWSLRR